MSRKGLLISTIIVFLVFALYAVFIYREPCGPPVMTTDYYYEPPSWFSFVKPLRDTLGIPMRPAVCPICLASNTLIETPSGLVLVQDLKVGMPIWTTDKSGHRVSGVVQKISRAPVSPTHQMVHLVLDDGRELFVSPGHPTTDGRTIGNLMLGELYDGASVVSVRRVPYGESATYDVLPSGETGFYWANRVLLDSTLH